MDFASAAGTLAVTREGAVPSVPSREEAEDLLAEVRRERREGRAAAEGSEGPDAASEAIPRGGGVVAEDEGDDEEDDDDGDFPLLFGSRLNSMKDRPDLADPSLHPLASPREYVRRQARIRGLGCVDFNYPQHFNGHWKPRGGAGAGRGRAEEAVTKGWAGQMNLELVPQPVISKLHR